MENAELRERLSAQLAGAGWGRRFKARLWRGRVATLARFALTRPGFWRGLPASFKHGDSSPAFDTPEAAVAWALSNPREPDELTGELRALLEDRRTERCLPRAQRHRLLPLSPPLHRPPDPLFEPELGAPAGLRDEP